MNCFDMILDEIENAVTYQQIYIDKSQNKVNEEIDEERKAEIADKARVLIRSAHKRRNADKVAIIDKLMQSEPFNKFPELKQMLMEED